MTFSPDGTNKVDIWSGHRIALSRCTKLHLVSSFHQDTLLVVANPLAGIVVGSPVLSVEWAILGPQPTHINLLVDNRIVATVPGSLTK